jgi:DNA-binding NarL/FixJ family response regulator
MSIKILLADDHTILRHGLSRLFQQQEDICVIGQANDGHEVVSMVRQLSPDIVIMDIAMPQLNGIEATRKITAEFPKVKVIGLSMHTSDKYIREMFRAGASGYLLKNCPFEELVEAIKAVAEGKTFISPSIGDTIIKQYTGQPVISVLSQREREVLQLVAEGKTTKHIGMQLYISPKTVEVHRLNIMNKLDIDNVAQLTKYAVQQGLTQPEP